MTALCVCSSLLGSIHIPVNTRVCFNSMRYSCAVLPGCVYTSYTCASLSLSGWAFIGNVRITACFACRVVVRYIVRWGCYGNREFLFVPSPHLVTHYGCYLPSHLFLNPSCWNWRRSPAEGHVSTECEKTCVTLTTAGGRPLGWNVLVPYCCYVSAQISWNNYHHFLLWMLFPSLANCIVLQVPAVTRRPTRSGRLGVDKQGEYTYKNVRPHSFSPLLTFLFCCFIVCLFYRRHRPVHWWPLFSWGYKFRSVSLSLPPSLFVCSQYLSLSLPPSLLSPSPDWWSRA